MSDELERYRVPGMDGTYVFVHAGGIDLGASYSYYTPSEASISASLRYAMEHNVFGIRDALLPIVDGWAESMLAIKHDIDLEYANPHARYRQTKHGRVPRSSRQLRLKQKEFRQKSGRR